MLNKTNMHRYASDKTKYLYVKSSCCILNKLIIFIQNLCRRSSQIVHLVSFQHRTRIVQNLSKNKNYRPSPDIKTNNKQHQYNGSIHGVNRSRLKNVLQKAPSTTTNTLQCTLCKCITREPTISVLWK